METEEFFDPALLVLVTVAEAARCWGKHYTSVRRARDSGKFPLVSRSAGRNCFITVSSLRRRWGAPIVPLESLLG